MSRLILIACVLLTVSAIILMAVYNYILADWFIDDYAASTMTSADWYRMAAARAFGAIISAGCTSGVIYLVWRGIESILNVRTNRPRFLALGALVTIAAAGIAGAVRFAVLRPFI